MALSLGTAIDPGGLDELRPVDPRGLSGSGMIPTGAPPCAQQMSCHINNIVTKRAKTLIQRQNLGLRQLI